MLTGKIKTKIAIGCLLLIFINLASASLEISMNKETFFPEEKALIDIAIKNELVNKANYTIIYAISIKEAGEGSAMPSIMVIELEANEEKHIYINFSVEATTQAGNYSTGAEVYDANNNLVWQSLKNFEVKETNKNFDADLFVCEDKKCDKKSSVFIKGKTTYAKIVYSIKDAKIKASLKDTLNNIEELVFENNLAILNLKEVGNYEISVEISKEGYNPMTKTAEFAVIEKKPEIKDERICNNNRKCDGKENEQNCPLDCKKEVEKVEREFSYYALVIILVLVIIVIVVLLIKKLVKMRSEIRQEEFTNI